MSSSLTRHREKEDESKHKAKGISEAVEKEDESKHEAKSTSEAVEKEDEPCIPKKHPRQTNLD